MERDKRLASVIERVGDLPALPDVVADVLRLTDDPNSELGQIGDVIERDPALAAKILKVSNSPYYGMKQYVGTLKLSLVILGIREVRNIVLGVAVFDALRDARGIAVLGQGFWSHSFLAGAVGKRLGARMKLGLEGEAFVAGLLHDIGKLILLRQMGDDYAQLCREAASGEGPLYEIERQTLGFNHAEAAMALADQWNFPRTLTDAIEMHHPVEDSSLSDAKDPHLAAVVRLANRAARPGPSDEALAAVDAEAEAWALLEDAKEPIPAAERVACMKALLEELKEAPSAVF